MNLDQIEQQLNDQAADLRATDARLTALEADARLDAQLERLLAEWLLISALLLWHAIRHAPDESELWRGN